MSAMKQPSNYPKGFAGGVAVRGLPVLNSYSRNVLWVDSNGAQNSDGTFFRPYATVATAIAKASVSDIILIKAGHAETFSAAGGFNASLAGLSIIGLGQGSKRPTFTFNTAIAASVVVSAAGVSIENVIGVAGIDGLTNPFHIQAADCHLDIEWHDDSDTVEAARAVLTTAAADRLTGRIVYKGRTAGDACVNVARLVGVDSARLDVDFYGKVSTALVEFHTTACTDVRVTGTVYNSGTTDGSKTVVDTVTGSTWSAEVFDATAGAPFSGGSGSALAKDDMTAITDALYGANGVATYPSAAAAGNAVSLAEVLRHTQNMAAVEALNYQSDRYLSVTADFTSATWNTVATHEVLTVTGTVRMRMVIESTGAGAGATATIALGDEAAPTVWIGATTITDFALGELWYDTTPTTFSDTTSTVVLDKIVSGGKDVGYQIATAAATGGGLTFRVWWEPISADGAVVAGAGGVL